MNIREPEIHFGLEEFDLYKAAREFRVRIYKVIKSLPREEEYALGRQMRRAVISISNNVAEGHGRWHYQETMQFCRIARGSTEEIIDDLNVCLDENYFPSNQVEGLKTEGYKLIKQINGYISYLKRSQKKNNQ